MTGTPPGASPRSSLSPSPVSVVVVNWNTGNHLLRCVAALAPTPPHPFPLPLGERGGSVVVVDNGSSDGSAAAIRAAYPAIPVIENVDNRGYAAAVNQGVARTPQTPYVLIANADVLCGPAAIAAMARWLDQHPNAALVGPCLRSSDGRLQLSWGKEPHFVTECIQRAWWRRLEAYGWLGRFAATPRPVDWVLGACFMVRREAFIAVNGMDARYFMYFEEVDLCTRLRRAGWEVWYLPETIAAAVHFGRASTGQVPEAMAVEYRRSQLRYYQTWHGTWAAGLLRAHFWIRLGRTSQGRHVLRALA